PRLGQPAIEFDDLGLGEFFRHPTSLAHFLRWQDQPLYAGAEMTDITADHASNDLAGRVFFERVLLPYRTLPPLGFTILLLSLAGVRIAAGTLFVSLGAWPVCGFFGLDVGLVYLAFRLSYRSARQRETLRLGEDELTVERVGIRGERRLWRFQPFWV